MTWNSGDYETRPAISQRVFLSMPHVTRPLRVVHDCYDFTWGSVFDVSVPILSFESLLSHSRHLTGSDTEHCIKGSDIRKHSAIMT